MRHSRTLRYPVLLVEAGRHPRTMFDISYRQGDFLTLGRVPARDRYGAGWLFDASGRVFDYRGGAGWPRFGPAVKAVLEALVLPGLMAKPVALLRYFGPELVAVRQVDPDAFRDLVVRSLGRHVKAGEMAELEPMLARAVTFEAMIRAVDDWRHNGGARDADGHPLDADA